MPRCYHTHNTVLQRRNSGHAGEDTVSNQNLISTGRLVLDGGGASRSYRPFSALIDQRSMSIVHS